MALIEIRNIFHLLQILIIELDFNRRTIDMIRFFLFLLFGLLSHYQLLLPDIVLLGHLKREWNLKDIVCASL